MMNKTYDAAVIGAGVFGAWTAYQLQQAGQRVVLLDAYGAAHSRASSGGESRLIRMGYGADEIYTRWAMRALTLWQEFFAEMGRTELFQRTGVLWLARADDPYTLATRVTLRQCGVNFEELARAELEDRYPQFNFDAHTWALYEPDSGALLARRAVQTVVEKFAQRGDVLTEAVAAPTGVGRLSNVTTSSGAQISADIFVFACGPWLPKLFPDLLRDRIQPTRQEVYFFGTPVGDRRFSAPQMPSWIDFGAEVYGVPDLENRGCKLALDRHGIDLDPDTSERTVTAELLREVRQFLAARFPALRDAPLVEARVCQYENTSNGDFLIDRHPDFANVWLIGGGSGHGFKHGPALGEYVAARIINGGAVEPRFTLATKAVVHARTVF
jgi:sarcosine oxidase